MLNHKSDISLSTLHLELDIKEDNPQALAAYHLRSLVCGARDIVVVNTVYRQLAVISVEALVHLYSSTDGRENIFSLKV